MDNNKVETLKEALVDVRRAHRLAYSFQERMLSLIQFISARLDLGQPAGIKHFSDPIGKYKGSDQLKVFYGMWAWDFLYSYVFEYFFDNIELDDRSEIALSIIQYADTGFFDSKTDERRDVAHFADPSVSCSKILFALEHIPKGCKQEFLDLYEIVLNKEYAASKHTESEILGKKSRLLLYSIPLERFADEHSSLEALQEYLTFLKRKDIELEFV